MIFKLNSGKIDFGTIVLFLSYLDFLQILILHEMQRELDSMANNSLNFVLMGKRFFFSLNYKSLKSLKYLFVLL